MSNEENNMIENIVKPFPLGLQFLRNCVMFLITTNLVLRKKEEKEVRK